MTAHIILDNLLAAAKVWHSTLPQMAAFTPWPDDLRYVERTPVSMPHIDGMLANPGEATSKSQALRDALLAAAPYVEWRHSYTEDEVGAAFLRAFGWFELAGPEGHYVTHQTRITVGYWGPGLFYPRHEHAPEELYSVVSGKAVFHADGEADLEIGAEGTRLHAPHQPHAMTTTDQPVLTLVLWRGEGIADAPIMSPESPK